MTIRGLSRSLLRVAVTVVVLAIVAAALIYFGVIRNPFGPTISGDLADARSNKPGLRVLFVGNSFTYMNGLPSMVRALLNSDRDRTPVYVVEYTRPGGRLKQAATDHRLSDLLGEVEWDYVVLQEQSEIPSFPDAEREQLMDGYAHNLAAQIRADGATTVLFNTWGYRNGDSRNVSNDTYAAMQDRLDHGYRTVAAETGAQVAPVGDAWREALERRSNLTLWANDGKHPSKLGTYLAACVFYRVLTHYSPNRVTYRDAVAASDAALIRNIAAATAASRFGP